MNSTSEKVRALNSQRILTTGSLRSSFAPFPQITKLWVGSPPRFLFRYLRAAILSTLLHWGRGALAKLINVHKALNASSWGGTRATKIDFCSQFKNISKVDHIRSPPVNLTSNSQNNSRRGGTRTIEINLCLQTTLFYGFELTLTTD